jgi:hypothetical protein
VRDEVVGKSILTWLLRIFKLLRCSHRATALKESSAMQATIARAAGLTEYFFTLI